MSRRFLPVGVLAAGAVLGGATLRANAGSATIGGLTVEDRHVVRRFSYGINAKLAGRVRAFGSATAWFEDQLHPNAVADPAGDEVDTWFPMLNLTPQQMWSRYQTDNTVANTTLADELSRWTLMRRTRSNRQVLEVMTEFWSNLLHVAAPNDKAWPHRASYDRTIRANALGRFDELLTAAVLHPAMLLYLDSYDSTKDAPNENLGRELLECHTVGRETPYTEDDVLNSTRILTGYTVDRGRSWTTSYNPDGHYTGRVRVLSFVDDNSSANGQATSEAYISYLARHPATARRVARKLLTRFVADVPSAAMVDDIAAVFTASNTDIPTTLRAIVNHPQFVSAAKDKVRTPTEDFVATLRALRIQPNPPRNDNDLARFCVWTASGVGQRPFDWPTPDGFPDEGPAWASATRMLGSWTMHNSLAAGGAQNAEMPDKDLWLPPLPAAFEDIVVHASRRLLIEDPTPLVLAAACEAVGQKPRDIITANHLFVRGQQGRVPLLLSCLLDSSLHMNR